MRRIVVLSAAVLAACGSGKTPVRYGGDARDPFALAVDGVPEGSDKVVLGEHGPDGPSAEDAAVREAQVRGTFGGLPAQLLPPFHTDAPRIVERSQQRAVARIVRVDEECSNLGGTHVTLKVETVERGRPARLLAAGGHGVFYDASVVHPGARFRVSWWAGIVPWGRQTAWMCGAAPLPAVDGTVTAAVALP